MLPLVAGVKSNEDHGARGDGYLGWPTALHLSACGHDVAVADNFAHRRFDLELGTGSLAPIEELPTRLAVWRKLTGEAIIPYVGDLVGYDFTRQIIADFRPDAVVHFAEQCSAPYSMIGRKHAVKAGHAARMLRLSPVMPVPGRQPAQRAFHDHGLLPANIAVNNP